VYHRHLHMLCLAVRCDRKHDCEPDPPRTPAATRRNNNAGGRLGRSQTG
jgi:hypothetical protein